MEIINSPQRERPVTWLIIAGNAAPIFGILLLNWQVYDLVFIYWCESVTIGLVNVVRMAVNQPDEFPALIMTPLKLFLIPFFLVHYNGFMAGHFMFITTLLGGLDTMNTDGMTGALRAAIAPLAEGFWVAVVPIVFNHIWGFIREIRRGETKQLPMILMFLPYKRVFVQQIAIIFGGMLLMLTGAPVFFAAFFVVLKTALDLMMANRKVELKGAHHA